MSREWLARILIISLVVAALAVPAWGWWQRSQGVLIHGRMAETGGWSPENLTAEVGKPLKLRLTSDDVMHGFAVGQMAMQPVDMLPGEISEIVLNFERPGKYVFYCSRWCSVNHWRMRGTIEVSGAAQAMPDDAEPPLYVQLGLDIDAEHHAEVLPERMPSAAQGKALLASLPDNAIPTIYLGPDTYYTNSPQQLWQALRAEQGLSALSDQEVWDVVAAIWESNTTPQALVEGQAMYSANCAACHGEGGAGDGVFAAQLTEHPSDHEEMQADQMSQPPTDFTDPEHLLAASPAHLQGKIIRGGMGTGMPYWGPIFTEEQTWNLVAYLWKFQFNYEETEL